MVRVVPCKAVLAYGKTVMTWEAEAKDGTAKSEVDGITFPSCMLLRGLLRKLHPP